MNVVYEIIFVDRRELGVFPYRYIGSKTNCDYIDGKIIDAKGKEYIGSSRWKGWKEIVKSEKYKVDILYITDIDSLLTKEREIQVSRDVVRDPTYFNMSLAKQCSYNMAGYGLYKHIETNKLVRLSVDDPMVLDGTYVGHTKGQKQSIESIEKRKQHPNPFLGQKHTQESKAKMSEALKMTWTDERRKEVADACSKRFKGTKKPKEWVDKLKERGFGNWTVLVHDTLPNIKINRDENYEENLQLAYDKGYTNAYKRASEQGLIAKKKCPHCGGEFVQSMFTRWHGDNCKTLRPTVAKEDMRGKGRKGRVIMCSPITFDPIDIDKTEREYYESIGYITNAKYIRNRK